MNDVLEAPGGLAELRRVDVGLDEGDVGLARDEQIQVLAGARRRPMEYVVAAQLPFEVLCVDAPVGAPGRPARDPYHGLLRGVDSPAEKDE